MTERVLDLFAGKGGWSAPWRDAGHEVLTVDIEPRFGADLTMDVRDLRPRRDLPWKPTVVLASPPCERFSTGGFHGHHFATDRSGRVHALTREGVLAVDLVLQTCWLITATAPRHFAIENPRALLRKIGVIPHPRRTVFYCHYGEDRMKPTDIWTNTSIPSRGKCHNRREDHGPGCCCRDHNPAPRGSVTGTQGMATDDAALIPYPLASDFLEACHA